VFNFLIDHNINQDLADLLRAKGHSVETALGRGLARVGDEALLLHAATHGEILVTHNIKDFELLHDAWRRWTAAWGLDQPTPAS